MNLAAYRNNIESIDMQHGAQGSLHLCYNQFQKIPQTKQYNLLPKTFWCWDKISATEINKWCISLNTKHKAEVVGHIWLNYIKPKIRNTSDKIILFSMQPYTSLIDKYIIETIKKTEDVLWILKLHPRQLERRDELIEIIEKENIKNKIHPFTFSKNTLPEALALSSLHLTKSSGSVMEATYLGVKTIILDKLGQNFFNDLIDDEIVFLQLDNSAEKLHKKIKELLDEKNN